MQYELPPVSSAALVTFGLTSAFLVAIALMSVWLTGSVSHGSIRITNHALELRVPFYSRSIPLPNLNLADARVLTLDATSEFRPTECSTAEFADCRGCLT